MRLEMPRFHPAKTNNEARASNQAIFETRASKIDIRTGKAAV